MQAVTPEQALEYARDVIVLFGPSASPQQELPALIEQYCSERLPSHTGRAMPQFYSRDSRVQLIPLATRCDPQVQLPLQA